MSKVMFFAHDPGGANAISPLIERFDNACVFAKGFALNILPGCVEWNGRLSDLKPDFIITGTSGNDFSERHLWTEAKKLNIPTMAILDTWVNYGVRFSEYGVKDLHLFNGKCAFLPDWVCVPDELAKRDAIKDGIPENIILPFGNPHFEEIARPLSVQIKANSAYALFASQPFDDNWRQGAEIIALEDLIRIVNKRSDITLKIRKHPKEDAAKFERYLSESVQMDETINLNDSIAGANVVVSVNSMVLIDALFMGKKIVSYQPKSKDGADDFILTRNGTLPFISKFDEFEAYFNSVWNDADYHVDNLIPHAGIIKRIVKFVEGQINGKVSD